MLALEDRQPLAPPGAAACSDEARGLLLQLRSTAVRAMTAADVGADAHGEWSWPGSATALARVGARCLGTLAARPAGAARLDLRVAALRERLARLGGADGAGVLPVG